MKLSSDLLIKLDEQVGTDLDIAKVARVSTKGGDIQFADTAKDQGLIGYLMRNKHGSPFEHGYVRFLLHAPIFVFWDHVRHRIGTSYNIESSRYRELEPVFYTARSSRTQTGKPGHYKMSDGNEDQDRILEETASRATKVAWQCYQERLDAGIAREQAMEILPMNQMIHGYISFNPRSLMKFIELRHEFARPEMKYIALYYQQCLSDCWPLTAKAFIENERIAP